MSDNRNIWQTCPRCKTEVLTCYIRHDWINPKFCPECGESFVCKHENTHVYQWFIDGDVMETIEFCEDCKRKID